MSTLSTHHNGLNYTGSAANIQHVGSAVATFTTGKNVGIGSTSPGGKLDVVGTYGDLKIGDPAIGTRITYYGTTRILMNSTDIVLYTNSLTERMRIKNDGKVGIGTSTPSTPFHVKGNAIDNQSLALFENNYSSGGVYFPALKAVHTAANHSYGIVGEFRVQGTSSDRPAILFSNGHTNNTWQIGQGVYGANDNFAIGYRNFHPDTAGGWSTARLMIDTAGKVGIGTTAPSEKLDVAGNIKIAGDISGIDELKLNRTNTSGTGNDYDAINIAYAGGWSGNPNTIAGINVTDSTTYTQTVGRFGVGYNGSQGYFAINGLYSSGYDATGDVFTVTPTSATFGGDLYVPNKIIHVGDTNTWIQFETDTISARTNGSDKITINSTGTIAAGQSSSGNALAVNRGSDGNQALRVQNSGEVVVSNNYFYAAGSGTSAYFQNTAVFRGAIVNDGGDVRVADNLRVEGDATITGTLTAQQFHSEFVSSSILHESGSTSFGNSSDDVHNFTGSLKVQGNISH